MRMESRKRDTSAALAGRRRAALNRKLAAARDLLIDNGYVVSNEADPCTCKHSLGYHGPTGRCYVGECRCNTPQGVIP
jgi:hypothetical protein